KSRSTFDVNQPTWTRALFLTMAANNKMIWTDQGIQWIADTVSWMAPINDYNASRMLNTFQHCRRLKPELRAKVQAALNRIVENVPEEISPTVQGQAKAYLADQAAGS
ncbi:MAG: aminopeptidase N C-terminal domain-containing protein, partial [Thermodesulfobacteriota bacterium]